MRAKVLSVVWHDKEPVFSCDWHSSGRVATGGADKEVKLWRVDATAATVTFLCGLARHAACVNVVRFSPSGDLLASGADDGFVFIWQRRQQQQGDKAEAEAAADGEEEAWDVVKSLKAPASDVLDLAWSADSRFVVGGSVENTAFVGSARSGAVL